ncbi:MAG: Na+/H+ antiporter NhaA [Rickettsiales bacterium]|nr:Na+/H+ antiporter NhaA [Rickettsiales bacterium]
MLKKNFVKTFFKSEISIGIVLFAATILALLIANSDNHQTYFDFLAIDIDFSFFGFRENFTIHDFINEALMTLFFLLVGLELKKEVLIGELSSKQKIILPAIAAFGGIIFPALIFILFNLNDRENLRGFATPTATDIAFAYGVIVLFGKRISNSIKVFLVALAVLDDLVAILIIAIFYSQNIDIFYLILAILPLFFLALLNYQNCNKILFYLISAVFLWLMILKSGVHPTLSGVVLALFIPLQVKNESPLSKLAHKIAPLVNFLILPIFAFANAGVKIAKFSLEIFMQPLVLGIIFGLFFGKQLGVMFFSFLAIKLKIANLPRGANWLQLYSAAVFTGIGFTMSLFIGSLAFIENNSAFNQIKIGVLSGSLLSVFWGIFLTYFFVKK